MARKGLRDAVPNVYDAVVAPHEGEVQLHHKVVVQTVKGFRFSNMLFVPKLGAVRTILQAVVPNDGIAPNIRGHRAVGEEDGALVRRVLIIVVVGGSEDGFAQSEQIVSQICAPAEVVAGLILTLHFFGSLQASQFPIIEKAISFGIAIINIHVQCESLAIQRRLKIDSKTISQRPFSRVALSQGLQTAVEPLP